jgi:hypothetical protein
MRPSAVCVIAVAIRPGGVAVLGDVNTLEVGNVMHSRRKTATLLVVTVISLGFLGAGCGGNGGSGGGTTPPANSGSSGGGSASGGGWA